MRIFRLLIIAQIAAYTIVIGGCRSDLIRAETADYVVAGVDAANKAQVFFDELLERDHAYFEMQLALDPACGVPGTNSGKPEDPGYDTDPIRPAYSWKLEPLVYPYVPTPLDELQGDQARLRRTPGCRDYVRFLERRVGVNGSLEIAENEAANERGRLCANDSDPIIICFRAIGVAPKSGVLKIEPFNSDTFATEIKTIKSLLKYLAALSELAVDPESNIADSLKSVADTLSDIRTIGGSSPLSSSANDKISAIGGLADVLYSMAQSAEQADAIRAILNEKGQTISGNVLSLASVIDAEVVSLAAKLHGQSDQLATLLMSSQISDTSARWQAIKLHGAVEEARVALRKGRRISEKCATVKPGVIVYECSPGLSPAARLLRGSMLLQQELIRIANDGELTAAQRKRQVEFAWKRFSSFIGAVADVFGAFGL